MSAYRLLAKAEADYRDIGRYTQRTWGPEQRRTYLIGLVAAFQRLADNPELGRLRPDLRTGLRSYVQGQHVIFYRIGPTTVEILRILHHARDVRRNL